MIWRAIGIAWLLFGLGACKASDDWQAEVNVQLFRAAGMDLGAFSLEARQLGGKTGKIALEDGKVFANCRSNVVRILPRPAAAGVSAPLQLELRVVASSLESPVINKISLDAASADRQDGRSIWRFAMMIGQGSAAVPTGCGAPLPDAGPPADLAGDQGGSKKSGEACSEDGQCRGSLCLKAITVGGSSIPMPDGYCSRDCANNPCPPGEKCIDSTDGNLKTIGAFCFVSCSVAASCMRASGYRCTTDGACFPK